uniref:Uncharacterized protein n=1 Tax=Oryza meridionalis TaxID=40149 RepID=A0A0E0C1Q3_9ORYZ
MANSELTKPIDKHTILQDQHAHQSCRPQEDGKQKSQAWLVAVEKKAKLLVAAGTRDLHMDTALPAT